MSKNTYLIDHYICPTIHNKCKLYLSPVNGWTDNTMAKEIMRSCKWMDRQHNGQRGNEKL